MSSTKTAVSIRNGYKYYGTGSKKKTILNGLYLTVPFGTIYGLLGASGCGKTTLLSCVVGVKTLDAGEIWVLGGCPGSVSSGVPGPLIGYMPQDIALVGEFKVKEAIYYFGTLSGMKKSNMSLRYKFLSKLLDLPAGDKYVQNCSGGQQRRISLAAALVHEPKLLILDEPTVGLDPVLRECIWNYLVDATVSGKMAVIITTHYIEEAKQAHQIGLMRNGQLLAEEPPDVLLRMFNCNSLEKVFLILSEQQNKNLSIKDATDSSTQSTTGSYTQESNNNDATAGSTFSLMDNNDRYKDISKKTYKKRPLTVKYAHVKALLWKNFTQFLRNPGGVAFMFLFPLLQLLTFFGAIGGSPEGLILAVVNEEANWTYCLDFMERYNTTTYDVEQETCHMKMLSCRFLQEIKEDIVFKEYYPSLPNAMEVLKAGKAIACLHFGKNFTNAFEIRKNELGEASSIDLDMSEITVWLDNTDLHKKFFIQKRLYSAYGQFVKGVFQECHDQPELGELPLKFLDPVYGKNTENYRDFILPGTLLTLIFFLTTSTTSTIIITDRLEGVWDRSLVIGVNILEILLTYGIVYFIMMAIQAVELLLVCFVAFESDNAGSFLPVIAILLMQGVSGMCYGFFISIISSTHSMANFISTGSFYPIILLCGVIWPLEGMPYALQIVSKCLPFTFPIISLRNVLRKGWTITNFHVYNSFFVLSIWILLISLASFYILKQKN